MIIETEQQLRDLLVRGGITTNDADTVLMFREFLERVGPPGSNPQAERELLADTQWREFLGVEEAQMTLLERRAQFVYDAARLAAIAAHAPIVPAPWVAREQPFRDQFLQVIERQCGPDRLTSAEVLHDQWVQAYTIMGWVYGEEYDRVKKVHPDMVPYAKLGQLEQDKDDVFIALCEIARQWIREEPTP